MSEKYFVTAQTLPHDFFVVTHVPNVDGPTKALLDTIRAKVDEMIRAGKAVKGTLGTVEHPHLPGGELYRDPNVYKGNERFLFNDRIRPWATNNIYNHNEETKETLVDYPNQRVVPEPFRALRVWKGREAAYEWIDFLMGLGAESVVILTDEELAALGRTLPPDEEIDKHMEA